MKKILIIIMLLILSTTISARTVIIKQNTATGISGSNDTLLYQNMNENGLYGSTCWNMTNGTSCFLTNGTKIQLTGTYLNWSYLLNTPAGFVDTDTNNYTTSISFTGNNTPIITLTETRNSMPDLTSTFNISIFNESKRITDLNNSKATTGNCPAGQVIQNITATTINCTTITTTTLSGTNWLYNDTTNMYWNETKGNNTYVNEENLTLNQILNPTGDKTFTMSTRNLEFTYTTGALSIEQTGATTNDLVHIHQHTGNPSAGSDLLHVEATDTDVLGINISVAGPNAIIANGNITTLNWFFGKLNSSYIQNVIWANITHYHENNSLYNISCDKIIGGSDSNYCSDAISGGGGNVTSVSVTNSTTHTITITNSDSSSVSTNFIDYNNYTTGIVFNGNNTPIITLIETRNDMANITSTFNISIFNETSRINDLNTSTQNNDTILYNNIISRGNWTLDKTSYNTTTQLASIFYNKSNLNNYINVTNLTSLGYATLSTTTTSIGNWSLDKTSYNKTTELRTIFLTNNSNINVTNIITSNITITETLFSPTNHVCSWNNSYCDGGMWAISRGTTAAHTNNTIECYPYINGQYKQITEIGFRIATANISTGGIASIYDSNNINYPNNLITNSTFIVLNTTGIVTTNVSNIYLKPNKLYWLCYIFNSTTANGRVNNFGGSYYETPNIIGFGDTTVGTAPFVGLNITYTFNYSGMPNTFPAGANGVTKNLKTILFRVIIS